MLLVQPHTLVEAVLDQLLACLDSFLTLNLAPCIGLHRLKHKVLIDAVMILDSDLNICELKFRGGSTEYPAGGLHTNQQFHRRSSCPVARTLSGT